MRKQESEYESGFFLLRDPIPFDGTIVHITASGYCALKNRDDQRFQMSLVQFDAATVRNVEYISAVCDFTRDTNTSVGTVNEDVMISLLAGDYLGIWFNYQCAESRCPFRPATTNSDSKIFLYLNDSFNINSLPERIRNAPSVGLEFSYTIIQGETVRVSIMCKTIITVYNPDVCKEDQLNITAILLSITLPTFFLVSLIILLWLLCKYYRNKRKGSKVMVAMKLFFKTRRM